MKQFKTMLPVSVLALAMFGAAGCTDSEQERAEERTEQAAQETEREAREAADYTEERAEDAGNEMEEEAEDAGDYTERKANEAGDYASNAADEAGEYFDDAAITTKVKAAIFGHDDLSSAEINVETEDGVVQLSGFVEDESDIDLAEEVAEQVEGVQSVENDIQVKD